MSITVDGIIFELQRQGGISRYFTELLLAVSARHSGLDINVLSAIPHPIAALSSDIGWRTIPAIGERQPESALLQGARMLARAVNGRLTLRRQTDSVWHSTYYTTPLRWRGPVVVTVHDLIYERAPELFKAREVKSVIAARKRSIRVADALCCVSEATRDDLLSLYDVSQEQVHIVSPAVPISLEAVPREAETAREPFLLFVGGRGPHKNFGFLLRSYSTWEQRDSYALLVAGPPLSPDELGLIRELGLQERVRIVAWPGDYFLGNLYQRASALVHPSLYEGFGIPVLEALHFDCPVAASSIRTSREIAGDSAFYFDPRIPDSLHMALTLATTPQGESGEHLAPKASERFSWDQSAETMISVYRALGG